MIHIGRIFHFRSLVVRDYLFKQITEMPSLERVLANNNAAEGLLNSLKNELAAIKQELIARKKKELQQENVFLVKQVEAAKSELIQLECRAGIQQFPIPGVTSTATAVPVKAETKQESTEGRSAAAGKPEKEKKPKKEKLTAAENKNQPTSSVLEAPVDVGRLDMRVGKIVDVSKHPDADSLYLEKIDCGEPAARTVVSGLVKFLSIEELCDRMVIVLCNLKPAKMRGITSEAMVMCASTPEKVEVLAPPIGSIPGDLVHCEGYTRNPDAQMNPKKKIFETCAPDLKTNGNLVACYKDAPLHVPGKGNIVAQTLKNVQVK